VRGIPMKKLRSLLFLLLVCVCALPLSNLRAQNFDLQTNGVPAISLDGEWRFQTGDNPDWASPAFDDSRWALLKSNEPWTDQGYNHYAGIAWYRFHATVPARITRVSLYLPRIFTCYEIYANGMLVGTYGKMPPNTQIYEGGGDFRLYALPPGINTNGSVEIALRIWQAPAWAAYQEGGPLHGGGLIGASSELARDDSFAWRRFWFYLFALETLGFIEFLAGVGALILFTLRRKEPEYLWFSLVLLFQAAAIAFDLFMNTRVWIDPISDIGATTLAGAVNLASIALYLALLKPRRTWLLTLSVICAFAAILAAPVAALFPQVLNTSLTTLVETLLRLPMSVWIVTIFFTAVRRNSRDARLLVLPVLLSLSITLYGQLQTITYTLGWQNVFWRPNIVLADRPFRIEVSYITDLLFLFAVMAILILRFSRTRGQEERYASEMEGARNVQQFLIPDDLPEIPGLTIESVYRPAREVGGDFFQILPDTADGSTLIVVGDVAGKGLEAGMLATLIVGAVRTAATFTTDPALILSTLNNRLCGRGNATCVALRIEADGAATLVNAGHLPPYLNGIELPMEGALPLGTIRDIEFPVLRFQLSQGDSLMLMSDGIAEAQRPDGELFGFDRISELLERRTTAASLVTAAQDFGQEDDITVLTIARTAFANGA
jgi:sigma-B regulation protein RsbU (phosphoserine phosphatase)